MKVNKMAVSSDTSHPFYWGSYFPAKVMAQDFPLKVVVNFVPAISHQTI